MVAEWNGITLPDYYVNDVFPVLERYPNVPPALAVATSWLENGSFNPTLQSRYIDPKTGQREPSYGYFQLHINGVGSGHDIETELKNGRRNAEIAIAEMSRRLNLAPGDWLHAIGPWSVKPDAVALFEANPYVYIDGKQWGGDTTVVVTDPITEPNAPGSRLPSSGIISTPIKDQPSSDVTGSPSGSDTATKPEDVTKILTMAGLVAVLVAAYAVANRG